MRLRILVRGVASEPVVLDATQVVIELADGTPVAAGAEYGQNGAVAFAHYGDEGFHRMLRTCGVEGEVSGRRLVLPGPPPGARLVAGPSR